MLPGSLPAGKGGVGKMGARPYHPQDRTDLGGFTPHGHAAFEDEGTTA